MSLNNLGCCGIKEYVGIQYRSEPKEFLKEIYQKIFETGHKFGVLIFSDRTERTNGEAIQKMIEEKELGPITKTTTKNPNSGHTINVWTWTIDNDAVKNCYLTNGMKNGSHTKKAIFFWLLRKKFDKLLTPKKKLTPEEKKFNSTQTITL